MFSLYPLESSNKSTENIIEVNYNINKIKKLN